MGRSRLEIHAAVLASGVSGLTWELLWQHRTALSLGVSAYGTAVTLSAVMGGIGLGSLLAAWLARRGRIRRPLRAYGVAELVVGIAGLAVPLGLGALSALDTRVWDAAPGLAPAVHMGGVALVLLAPATAMGTTLPLLAACARETGTRVPILYALNVTGAVLGVLGASFVTLPLLGVGDTERVAAAINLSVALWAMTRGGAVDAQHVPTRRPWPARRALLLAFASGFTVFALEVSWFRSLRAALQSTTESFALVLAAFLSALALGAALAPRLRRRFPRGLDALLPLAALAVLCATPAVDGMDRWLVHALGDDFSPARFTPGAAAIRLACLFAVLGIPATLLGTVLPWLMAEHESTEGVGGLTAVNTLGAVSGALLSGFVLLPAVGASRASWIAALVIVAVGALARPSRRLAVLGAGAAAAGLAVAVGLGAPTAHVRVQGYGADAGFEGLYYVAEGPDTTVQVTRSRRRDALTLLIDGFAASDEGPGNEYMRWMGHLPALARSRVDEALVICFGTGQTADAVREQTSGRLTVVDVNPAVFGAARFFASNDAVLDDPRVEPVVMDGRAYLRRSERRFDLVTLEPMPPNFAGVNNLYSLEFYELVRERLTEGGVAAQWVPFHLISPRDMLSIVATFRHVFPHTRLFVTPPHGTGILVGSGSPWELRESPVPLPAHAPPLGRHFALDVAEVEALAEDVPLVTDDNQRLAYGWDRFSRAERYGRRWYEAMHRQNLDVLTILRSRLAQTGPGPNLRAR